MANGNQLSRGPDEFSEEEAKRRFETALRGAQKVGHKTMKQLVAERRAKRRGSVRASASFATEGTDRP